MVEVRLSPGEVYLAPDLAAVPTSTAPMPALPVDSRCTLGVLYLRNTVDQSTSSWGMVRKCLDGMGEGGELGGWARCPLTFGRLRPAAAATVPAVAVHRLPHTSHTRNESGGHIVPGSGPCRRDRARTGDKYTADCPGHHALGPGASWVEGAPLPPFSVDPLTLSFRTHQ